MGIYVLLLWPNEYENFVSAKSKRSTFGKLVDRHSPQFSEFAQAIMKTIAAFDDQFRTSEAHGAGVLRKWTLVIEPLDESPQFDLNQFQSKMNTILTRLGDIFRGPTKTGLRDLFRLTGEFRSSQVPADLRRLTRDALWLLARITYKYAASHPIPLLNLRIHAVSIFQLGLARARRPILDPSHKAHLKEMEKEDLAEIEKALSELPSLEPRLLGLLHGIGRYGEA